LVRTVIVSKSNKAKLLEFLKEYAKTIGVSKRIRRKNGGSKEIVQEI